MTTAQLTPEVLDHVYRKLLAAGAQPTPGDPPQFYFYLVQYRFPRTKKRRIRNKWANDWRNYRAPQRMSSLAPLFEACRSGEPPIEE